MEVLLSNLICALPLSLQLLFAQFGTALFDLRVKVGHFLVMFSLLPIPFFLGSKRLLLFLLCDLCFLFTFGTSIWRTNVTLPRFAVPFWTRPMHDLLTPHLRMVIKLMAL